MVSAIYHKTGTGIMNNDYNSKSVQELADGLALYLKQGYINPLYINCDCEDEGAEEAGFYLDVLSVHDPDLSCDFRKRIMESPVISNDYFKAQCMEWLLLSSDKYREYVIQYLSCHYDVLPVSVLQKAMFYFYCAKRDPDDNDVVPDSLIVKLKSRYHAVKDNKDVMAYELTELKETSDDFYAAYPSP
ncbi:TPA: hypothetical protein I7721_20545 [Vibrio vulnificus]|nr:hypothetical protein [Vibrio vulnificus]